MPKGAAAVRTKLQPGLCCERWAQTRSLGCGQKPPALCSLARTQHLPSQPGKNPSDLPPKHPRTQGPGLQGDGISSRAAGPRAQTEAPRLPGPIPRPVTEKQDKTSNVSKGCFSQETTEVHVARGDSPQKSEHRDGKKGRHGQGSCLGSWLHPASQWRVTWRRPQDPGVSPGDSWADGRLCPPHFHSDSKATELLRARPRMQRSDVCEDTAPQGCLATRPSWVPRLYHTSRSLGAQVTWGPSSLPRAQAQAGVNSARGPVGLPRQVA